MAGEGKRTALNVLEYLTDREAFRRIWNSLILVDKAEIIETIAAIIADPDVWPNRTAKYRKREETDPSTITVRRDRIKETILLALDNNGVDEVALDEYLAWLQGKDTT